MAIPSASQFNMAVLEFASEHKEVFDYENLTDFVSSKFSLTEADFQERLPSGYLKVRNRLHWAAGELKRAGLLDSSKSGLFQINNQGRDFLKSHKEQDGIGITLLRKIREERVQRESSEDDLDSPTAPDWSETSGDDISDETDVPPNELIINAREELQRNLEYEVLERLKSVDPYLFEKIVVRLLEKMGYGQGSAVGGSGDGGIDGIINQDPLGLEKVYVQAKRWEGNVGTGPIYSFGGSLGAKGASKGVFITTSTFNSNARQAAQNISAGGNLIRLIDGQELARLMIRHNVGVVTENIEVKKLDENFFSDPDEF